tara:strand:+ start:29154 stop:29360 length:207 start_codon:yes stop_codon:yes gene_type:complete
MFLPSLRVLNLSAADVCQNDVKALFERGMFATSKFEPIELPARWRSDAGNCLFDGWERASAPTARPFR